MPSTEFPESDKVGLDIPDRPDRLNSVALLLENTGEVIHLTAADRDDLIAGATIIARKTARIVGIVSPGRAVVLTDRGPMQVGPGDIIATNHPDDDPGSDVWPISRERFDATYAPADSGDPTDRTNRLDDVNPHILIRVTIDKLRAEAGARDAKDRQRALAITNLEQALLWLNAADVL